MDTPKHNNTQQGGIAPSSMSHKNPDPISFFEKNEAFTYVYKKTEKLTTALYMVSNLFSDSEPMKWSLRKKVSDLLSFTVMYKDVSLSQYAEYTHDVKTRVLEIVSLLEVSSRSGLVSPMNFSILKQEFSHVLTVLDNAKATHTDDSHTALAEDFFDVAHAAKKDISENSYRMPQVQAPYSHIKDRSTTPSSVSSDVFKRNNRQNIILQLLKKKKALTIKDISEVIRDCSEKTIQRELISLITAGVLKKTGERRWSIYSLAVDSVAI